MIVCIIVIPILAIVIISTLAVYCCYNKKKLDALKRENQAMHNTRIGVTPQLIPATVPRPGQNNIPFTNLNLQVYPRSNPPIPQPQQRTESSFAHRDEPPPYSSLFQPKVEPPSYTTWTANSAGYGYVSSDDQHPASSKTPPASLNTGWFECYDGWSRRDFRQSGRMRQEDRPTHRRIDRQKDGRTDRTDSQTDWQTDGRTEGRIERQRDRLTVGQKDRQTDGRTERQTDSRTDRQTDERKDQRMTVGWLNCWLQQVRQPCILISRTGKIFYTLTVGWVEQNTLNQAFHKI